MLRRRRQLAAKIESAEGTAETLAASDAKLLVENPVMDVDPTLHERNPVGSSFSKVGKLVGKRPASLGFNLKLRGSGAVGTDAEWFKLLKACGFQVNNLFSIGIGAITSGPFQHGETITGGTSAATGRVVMKTVNGTTTLYFVPLSGTLQDLETITGGTSGASAQTSVDPVEAGDELKPVSNPASVPSLTLGSYEDGVRKVMKGSRGKVKFTFVDGEPVVMEFEFMGAFAGTTDVSLLSNISHETTKPPVLLSAALAVDAYQAKVGELEIDWANTLSIRDDVNDAAGLLSYLISDRSPGGSFNPEMVIVATHDFFGKWFSNSEMILDFQVGTTAGNKFRFYAPKIQYEKIADEEREGISIARASFSLNGSLEPGDDELVILAL